MPQSPTPEQQAEFERSVQVAKFFGGQPRAATTAGPRKKREACPAGLGLSRPAA